MKLFLTAAMSVVLLSPAQADSPALIEAASAAEAASVIRAASTGRAELISDAVGLGVADPVELIFALVSPDTSPSETELIANALTLAAPRRADEVAASTAIAAGIISDKARLTGLIAALVSALNAAPLDDAAREEEMREVLAALLSVTDPNLRVALANAVAGGDGAALLASLGVGPETAAITPPRRPFGEGPAGLTLTPGAAAQDAPSAN